MTETVILAIIGGVVTILTAFIGKLSFDLSRTKRDAKAARHASEKTEHSINNRETPLSDRLDAVGKAADAAVTAVASVAETLEDHGRKLDTHTKDLRGVDVSVGILRGADRDLQSGLADTRRELADHIRESRKSVELANSTDRTVRRFLPLLEKHGIDHETN